MYISATFTYILHDAILLGQDAENRGRLGGGTFKLLKVAFVEVSLQHCFICRVPSRLEPLHRPVSLIRHDVMPFLCFPFLKASLAAATAGHVVVAALGRSAVDSALNKVLRCRNCMSQPCSMTCRPCALCWFCALSSRTQVTRGDENRDKNRSVFPRRHPLGWRAWLRWWCCAGSAWSPSASERNENLPQFQIEY